MSAAHTPTPWWVDSSGKLVVDADGHAVASIYPRFDPTQEMREGERFDEFCARAKLSGTVAADIVRYVNAHDELVAALRELVENADTAAMLEPATWEAMMERASAVLAKVGVP